MNLRPLSPEALALSGELAAELDAGVNPAIDIPTAPGWYPGLSLETYLAIPAMSASGMEAFRRSPAHYRWEKDHPSEPTQQMREGTALHLALLEPHLFQDRYIALAPCESELKSGPRKGEPCGKTSKAYRDGRSYCGTHDPRADEPLPPNVLPAEALGRVHGMKGAVLRHPDASRFFIGRGDSEITGIWRDPGTGVLCKLRLDRQIDRAKGIHVDLKGCPNAAADAFPQHAARMGYVHRSAWYRRGLKALEVDAWASALIAVEWKPPHGCQLFLLDEGDLTAIGTRLDGLLGRYADCLERDEWPAYDPGMRELKLKPWDLDEPSEEEEAIDAAA